MQPSEEGRKNLRYLMHLATPLIQARAWRSEDNHAFASFAGIYDIFGSSRFRGHPKTSSVPLCTRDIKSPGGINWCHLLGPNPQAPKRLLETCVASSTWRCRGSTKACNHPKMTMCHQVPHASTKPLNILCTFRLNNHPKIAAIPFSTLDIKGPGGIKRCHLSFLNL
jgi:hypothetical protein